MEEMVVKFGFALTCLFFLLALCINSNFILGALVGLVITFFGWFFWEEY